MKKHSKGMNKRKIKRKLGLKLDEKEMENMMQEIQSLLTKDIFSSVKTGGQFVTVDKRKLEQTIKGKMALLESQWKDLIKGTEITDELNLITEESKKNTVGKEGHGIKINIS